MHIHTMEIIKIYDTLIFIKKYMDIKFSLVLEKTVQNKHIVKLHNIKIHNSLCNINYIKLHNFWVGKQAL